VKTDSIFYQLFKIFPSSFFQLIGEGTPEDYTFSSVEVKALSFRLDGVFLPKRDRSPCPILFTEVQFWHDEDIYWRFMTESFLLLGQEKPNCFWQAILIFEKRSFDPGIPKEYQCLANIGQIQVFYLNELQRETPDPLGLEIFHLIIEPPKTAVNKAKQLIEQTEGAIPDATIQRNIIGLIQDIIVYKFPEIPRREIEAMFGLEELRKTRYYQDVAEEERQAGERIGELRGELRGELKGKLKAVPHLAASGLTVKQIAQALELKQAQVKEALKASQ
jgi:predicted transposase/invertase (TIGR01784 family)